MKINKILWACDGSRESEAALEYASYLAGLYNSEITGLFANIVDYPLIFYYPFYEEYVMNEASRKEKEYTKKFNRISSRLAKKNIKFKKRILRGDPDEVILRVANKNNMDLIAMGITGRNFIDRMIIGSTALRVLRKSKIPVLAVKSKKADIRFKKILVPIELSDKLDKNLRFVLEYAVRNNSHVTVLYIVSGINHRDVLSQSMVEELVGGGKEELDKLVDKVLRKGVKNNPAYKNIKTKVIFANNIPWTITDYAKRNNFDLISINSHGKNFLKRLFIGSVAEEVIRKSSCNILAFKP